MLRARKLCSAVLSIVCADAQSVMRTAATIASAPSDNLILTLQLEGRCAVSQRGVEAVLHPGAIAAVSAAEPYRFVFDARFRQLVLRTPSAGGLAGAASGMSYAPPGSAAASLCSLTARTLLHPGFSVGPAEAHSLSAVLSALAAACLTLRDGGETGARPERTYAAAMRIIAVRGEDPDLDAADVAAELGLSPRTLARAFAKAGDTVCGALWEHRLQAARDRLSDPRWTGLPVTEIALACGFADASHFARRFRRRFGMSATEARKAGLRGKISAASPSGLSLPQSPPERVASAAGEDGSARRRP